MPGMLGSLMGGMGGGALGTLFVRLTADSTNLVKGMTQAETAVASSSAVMLKTAGGLAAGLTAAFTAIGAIGVREFAKFEEQMVKSTAIMGNISSGLRKELETTARSMARETSTSADKLAQAYFYLASAGLDAQQSMAALSTVNKFAIAGDFDLAQATTLLLDSQSALGLRTKDVTRNMLNMAKVSDVLSKANILANANIQEFAEALTNRAAAAMKVVNKDIEEGVAVLAAFADRGIKGANAGEQFSIVMRDLQRTALENSTEFQQMGITVFDNTGKMMRLADIIGQMEQVFANMSDEQKRATFEMLGFQDRSLGSMLSLMGASQAINDYEKALRGATGATDEIATKMEQSFNAQLRILGNQIKDLFISIGEQLVPVLKAFNAVLKEGSAKDFNATFEKFNKQTAPVFIAVLGVIGDIIYGWKLLFKGVEMAILALGLALNEIGRIITMVVAGGIVKVVNGAVDALNYAIAGINKLIPEAHRIGQIAMKPLTVDYSSFEQGKQEMTLALEEAYQEWIDLASKGSFSERLQAQYNKAITQPIKDENEKVVNDVKATVQEVKKQLAPIGVPMSEIALAFEKSTKKLTPSALMPSEQSVLTSFQTPEMNQQIAIEKELAAAEDRVKILESINKKELDMVGRVQEEKLKLLEAYNLRLKQLQMAQAQVILATSSKMFEDLATISASFAGKQSGIYKTMFAISKAFAIAEASVKIMQGVASAASLPWPSNLAAMASVIAATASIVSNIQSIKLEFGGQKAEGGPVSPRRAYLVGEQGPEMFVPSQRGNIVPNEQLGTQPIRVVVNNYTDARPEVTQREEGGERIVEVVIRRVKDQLSAEIRDGRGDVNRALENSFGLRRGTR